MELTCFRPTMAQGKKTTVVCEQLKQPNFV
jgi:hypothetical protein